MSKIHLIDENGKILCNKNLSIISCENTTSPNEVTCKNCKYIISRQMNRYKIRYKKNSGDCDE